MYHIENKNSLCKKGLAVLLLSLIAWPGSAHAKCPSVGYLVLGRLAIIRQGALDGARVTVFLDEHTRGNSTTASADGRFMVEVPFNTYSGVSLLLTDQCGKKPATVTIMVEHPRITPTRAIFRTNQLRSTADPLELEIPAFELWNRD
ncbi:hypothetical protein JCM14635_16480 [Megalodesulfovibrio paquesii]